MKQISKTTPEEAQALVARLEARRSEAHAKVSQAEADCANALLDAELAETKESSALRDKARCVLIQAQGIVGDLNLAIAKAKEQHRDALRLAEEKGEERQWKEVEKLAKERASLAEAFERDAASLAECLKALIATGHQMFEVAPKKEAQIHHSILSGEHVESACRLHLKKLGLHWAINWAWTENSIPSLTQRIAEGNGWILSRRGPAETKAQENV